MPQDPNIFDLPDDSDDAVIKHRRIHERHGADKARLSLNLTAMIDVVFLLLIYFMVATEFKVGEEVYRLDLPESLQAAAERDPFELDEEPLRIGIESLGLQGLRYRVRLQGPYPDVRTFDELYEFLRSRQATPGSMNPLFKPDHPIIINPASSARWEHAIGVFNAAARAHYTNIIFAKPG